MGLLGSEILGKGRHRGSEGFGGDGPLADQLAHKRVKRLDIAVANILVGLEEPGEEQTTDDPEDRVFDHGRQSSLPIVIIIKVAVMQFEVGVVNHEFLLGDAADGPGVEIDATDNLVQVPSASDSMVGALDIPSKIVSLFGQSFRERVLVLEGRPSEILVVAVDMKNSRLVGHHIDQTDIFFSILRKFGPVLTDLSVIVEKTLLDQTGNYNPLDSFSRRVNLLQGPVVVGDTALEIF
jgi:hypothetical protein